MKSIFICTVMLAGCAPVPERPTMETAPIYDYAYRVYLA